MQTTAWIHRERAEDIDTHAAAQVGWDLRYEQLSGGRFCGEMLRLELPGLTVVREDTNVALRQRGRLHAQAYGFAMALQDRDEVFFDGQRVPPHAIMCGKGDEVDLCTPPDFSLIAVVVQRDLLNPLWESMYHKPLAHWLEHQLVLATTAPKAEAVRQQHLAVLAQASSLAQWPPDSQAGMQLRDEILIEWIEALPPRVDTSELEPLRRRKQMVDRACELMLAHADEPLSILQVCARVGASRRKLNYCFQDVLGTTPVKYLRSMRLNGVRRALRLAAPGTTVQDVATHWGFWHLSQFSQDYKHLFGELPSATLRAASGAARGMPEQGKPDNPSA